MTSTTYPDGSTLASSALTLSQINNLMQSITSGALGVNPPDPAQVRVDFPVEGQPFVQRPSDDVCFLACVTEDEPYSRVRDQSPGGVGSVVDPVTQTWVYTRNWRVAWTFYGPNSLDRARQLHSATFMDWFNNQLSSSNLYPVEDPPEPTRTPEQFNAQWWERCDFKIDLYEQITETLTWPADAGAVTSVEVRLYDGSPADPVADFTVTKQ